MTRRFKVKTGFSIHAAKGHLQGPDSFPEDWLSPDHLEELLTAGIVSEVVEAPPATPAAEKIEEPGRTGRKGR